MQEGDVQLLSTLARLLVNQTDTLSTNLSQRIGYTVLDAESYMVNTLVALIKPLLDGALG